MSDSLSPAPLPTTGDLNPLYWEERYQIGTDRWDLGQPAPPLIDLLESAAAPPPGKMIVLGSGRGHDALWFASRGFEVMGVDFAPSAIASATTTAQANRLAAQFLQRDIFDLIPEFAHKFDYVLEHTCFCAIALEQRSAYVKLVHDLLRPGGELIALFWAHSRPGGPPFGTNPTEITQLFAPYFDRMSLEPVLNSVPGRQHEEYLGRFRVKTF
jgi:SAM-dependent methyltransferase